MTHSGRPQTLFSLEQAANASAPLAALTQRIRESQHCLEQVKHLIPETLRAHVKAGPLQEGEWCLLVGSAAASAKLRQLLPSLQTRLTQNGTQVNAIRLKVQSPHR